MSDRNNTLNFTIHSEDAFYDTVDTEAFKDEDAESIYDHLQNKMKVIPFGDYLKRYIFNIAGFEGDWNDVSVKEYQEIIMESFAENNTPKSFSETSTKFSALAKNWLTQASVNRQVVFLLGFGLNMSAEDVSKFLLHAQRERDFNFRSPFEIICWYCFKHGYKYQKFEQLMEKYREMPVSETYIDYSATVGIRSLFLRVDTEAELMQQLSEIKFENEGQIFSVSSRLNFDSLYEKTREIIAEKYTEDSIADAKRRASEYFVEISNSEVLTQEEKLKRTQKIRDSWKRFTADDISEADSEKFLCCGVPFDGKGNLLKFSNSTLAKHFSNKRMSRQHISSILSGKTEIDRFDLITLCFFKYAMDETETNSKRRYFNFVEEINNILNECYMGELYIANPYECFLLMCLLSDWPMGTYADVLEKSFEN